MFAQLLQPLLPISLSCNIYKGQYRPVNSVITCTVWNNVNFIPLPVVGLSFPLYPREMRNHFLYIINYFFVIQVKGHMLKRATYIRTNNIENRGCLLGVALNVHIVIHEQRGDLGAVEQITKIIL